VGLADPTWLPRSTLLAGKWVFITNTVNALRLAGARRGRMEQALLLAGAWEEVQSRPAEWLSRRDRHAVTFGAWSVPGGLARSLGELLLVRYRNLRRNVSN
jgi:hypothetical protein